MADDLFEAVQLVKQQYPDDIGQWPEMCRLSAYASRDRLLKRDPSLSVVSERSYCIDSSDDRWNADVPAGLTHALIYEVKLSSPIAA